MRTATLVPYISDGKLYSFTYLYLLEFGGDLTFPSAISVQITYSLTFYQIEQLQWLGYL